MSAAATEKESGTNVRHVNTAPADFDPARDLPQGFIDFLLPLHQRFTARQQAFIQARAEVLAASHRGQRPGYLPSSEARSGNWKIELPAWCADQRNQMTGPADDAELVVKMLNSGAPGVMLDLEDSMANGWPNLMQGTRNILQALNGVLSYFDQKRSQTVGIQKSTTVILTRPRGLHISQAGILPDELMSASLFDVAMVAYQAEPDRLRHPLSFIFPNPNPPQKHSGGAICSRPSKMLEGGRAAI